MAYKSKSPIIVKEGGTGLQSATAYAPICGGTTATGDFQAASTGLGTAGYVLTSNGSSALPSFQTLPSSATDIFLLNGDAGGVVTINPSSFTGGTSGGLFSGSVSTMTLNDFTYVSLPTTTSSVGQIKINSIPFFFQIGGTTSVNVGSRSSLVSLGGAGDKVGIGVNTFLNTASFGGGQSVAIGSNVQQESTTSNPRDVAIGYNAAKSLTTTSTNVFIGHNVCSNAGTGVNLNIAIGINSMTGSSKTSATNNTAIGSNSGIGITTGTRNVLLGDSAGQDITTASSSIRINNVTMANTGNQLVIGAGTGTGTQQLTTAFIHGIRGITTGVADAVAVLIDSAGQLGTVSSSIRYKENIEDMNEVSSSLSLLRPVTFDFIGKPSHKKQVGLIAEEVKEIMPSLVVHDKNGEIESVKYHELSILLLNEIKKALQRIEYLESKLI